MSERNFQDAFESTLIHIEQVIDEQGEQLDYESQGGMLTIFCPNGTQVIISKQAPLSELWLAAKSGGFHFKQSANDSGWESTRDNVHFKQRLEMVIAEQAQEHLQFDV